MIPENINTGTPNQKDGDKLRNAFVKVVTIFNDIYSKLFTNTSSLVNDGTDGINPFITANDIPDVPEQVQSDFNQIDTQAPDFIKNKPENLSNFNDDIGASASRLPLSLMVDNVNGDDSTGQLENLGAPFATINGAMDALPLSTGETYTIYITSGTHFINERIQSRRGLRFVAFGDATIDFTNIKVRGSNELSPYVFENQVINSQSNRTWTFENQNISLNSDRSVKFAAQFGSGVQFKGTIKRWSWEGDEIHLDPFTNIKVLELIDFKAQFKNSGVPNVTEKPSLIHILKIQTNEAFNLANQYVGLIRIDYLRKTDLSTAANLAFGVGNSNPSNTKIDLEFGDIDWNGVITTNTVTCKLNNSKLNDTTRFNFGRAGGEPVCIASGKVESLLYHNSGVFSAGLHLENFTGKIGEFTSIGTVKIIDSNVQAFGYITRHSISATTLDALQIKGFVTILQDNPKSLILAETQAAEITIDGTLKTNATDFGGAVVEYTTNTFKEKKGEVVIRSKVDLVNKVLDNTLTYIIDGSIELSAGEYIEVPPNGNLTLNGYGLEASEIIKNVAGESIFRSPVGGSGGMQIDSLKLTMGTTTTSCFDLVDETGFNAIECVKVNFEGSGSIGVLDGYRQYLWTNIGFFGLSDGITFEGTSIGGFRSETVIGRNLTGTTGSIFKKGASLTFASRFFSNANIDLPSGWSVSDFEPSNFVKDNLFQLQGMIVTRAGVINRSDTNYFPNINEKDSVSNWSNNVGIRNTYVGGEWDLTTEATTIIPAVNTPVKLEGTTTYQDLQHFRQVNNNEFIYDATLSKDFQVMFQGIIQGGANDTLAIILRLFRDSTSSYENVKTVVRPVTNSLGGLDVAVVNLFQNITLFENDRVELWVENRTDDSNVILEENSQMIITERK